GGALDGAFFTVRPFGHEIAFGWTQVVALAAIGLGTAINCAPVRTNGHVAAAITGLKLALVVAIAGGAFLFAGGNWSHLALRVSDETCAAAGATPRAAWSGFGAAMLAALWAYNGWY